MDKESKRNRTQSIAMVLLMISSTMSIILRIRKMIHYSMIGEEPTGFDWYMITLGLIVVFLAMHKLISNKRSNPAVES